ncbi:MAG: XRE family transcriptional regulator [bacterium]|nr:XRE family transcriptional regulator [bacterium]
MAKRDVLIDDIANYLNIHRNSASNKVNGRSAFSIEQSMKIQEKFFPDLELKYLFATEQPEAELQS